MLQLPAKPMKMPWQGVRRDHEPSAVVTSELLVARTPGRGMLSEAGADRPGGSLFKVPYKGSFDESQVGPV
jgi:hypothetical protein